MSGIGFWEFFFLCMIGLVVLGPKRLPQVANQLGSWVGQARRMTRVLKRQLEEELDLGKDLNIRPSIAPVSHPPPRDDDSYSPLHQQPASTTAGISVDDDAVDNGAGDEAQRVDVDDDHDDLPDDEPPGTSDSDAKRDA